MKLRPGGLWHQHTFRRLWSGQAASLLANMLTQIIIPLIAVTFLDATPIQMGIIGAMTGVPAVAGIFIGVWADRRRRLPVMVSIEFFRFAVLLAIPAAYMLDSLTIEVIYAVSLAIGFASFFYEIVYRALLPSLVGKRHLVEANSKLELANSGAVAVGPALGGALVGILVAPFAAVLGAVMHVVSAVLFRSLQSTEAQNFSIDPTTSEESVVQSIKKGFSFFVRNRTLLGIAAAAMTLEFFGMAYDAIYILYLVREHEFTPFMIGFVFSFGSVGLFTASFVSSWLVDRFGVGGALLIGFLLMTIGGFLVPIADGSRNAVFAIVLMAEATFIVGVIIWNIGQVSLRQAITPDAMLGRVSSLMMVAARATVPVGSLAGGFLGEFLGLREAIYVFATGISLGFVWLFVMGIWRIKELPSEPGSVETQSVAE